MGLPISALALWLGTAFASGVNAYAVLGLLGLVGRFLDPAALPTELAWLTHPYVLGVALFLFACEFLIDKTRRGATLWDALHAFVRPMVATGLGFLLLAALPWWWQIGGALFGGACAFAVHGTKASIRFATYRRPERFPIGVLSLVEDATALLLTYLSLFRPVAALAMVVLGSVPVVVVLPRVFHAFLRAVNRTLDSMLSRSQN